MIDRFMCAGAWDVLGLMSGTSLDGLDAARLRFERDEQGLKSWRLLDHSERPLPRRLKHDLQGLIEGQPLTASAWAGLHVDLARVFAEFVTAEFPPRANGSIADLAAFPGQTVHHDPDGARVSLQIGSPAVFARLTGIDTIGEFRQPDVLLGGQGAPLVPLADALLHRSLQESRVLLNIGGIANVTVLPPGRGVEGVRAWDTGPGNTLLDLACRVTGAGEFDDEGRLAREGEVDGERLKRWLEQPWFDRQPPKSTGRELFGGSFLGPEEMAVEMAAMGRANLLATLVELTVEGIVRALANLTVDCLYVGGGGLRNTWLMERLTQAVHPLTVAPADELGLPAGVKEAADFALLALEAAAGGAVALPAVTGARSPAGAGIYCPGGDRSSVRPT
ncbi:MAG: anhydro-N-acetylmuramic acid kinase [bacterium]|nr:anhydro-N-acetylmuramic acid kinase [bacterium]